MSTEHARVPYHRACGPTALAAIAHRSEFVVADELLAIQRARGRITVPGTAPEDMHYWLISRGFTVEPWDLDADEPAEPAAAFAERVRSEPPPPAPQHRSVAESMVAQFPAVPRKTVETIVGDWLAEQTTLGEWIGAHPVGTFLVQVDGHYLAFRDGRVIAGDDTELREYGEHAVLRVERVSR